MKFTIEMRGAFHAPYMHSYSFTIIAQAWNTEVIAEYLSRLIGPV
jgi:hypothetical protein